MTFVGEVITGNVPNYIKLINKCLKESISVIQVRKIYQTCKQEPLEFQLMISHIKHQSYRGRAGETRSSGLASSLPTVFRSELGYAAGTSGDRGRILSHLWMAHLFRAQNRKPILEKSSTEWAWPSPTILLKPFFIEQS